MAIHPYLYDNNRSALGLPPLRRGLPRSAVLERRARPERWLSCNSCDARDKVVTLPGPDHRIPIPPNPKKGRVPFAGATVAETSRALTLKEASYPAVQYIPR